MGDPLPKGLNTQHHSAIPQCSVFLILVAGLGSDISLGIYLCLCFQKWSQPMHACPENV